MFFQFCNSNHFVNILIDEELDAIYVQKYLHERQNNWDLEVVLWAHDVQCSICHVINNVHVYVKVGFELCFA